MKRTKLTLRHEALADLGSDELHAVAGASGAPCDLGDSLTCPTTNTVVPTGCNCTGQWPSLRVPCTDTIQIEGTALC